MTAARTTQRFARATDAALAAVGGPSAWIGRSVRVPQLDPGSAALLASALERLGADVAAAPSGEGIPASTAREVIESSAWQQAVLTTVGRVTNLGFAQASVRVHGTGVDALGIARRLSSLGARVSIGSSDPLALLAASAEGFETSRAGAILPDTLFVIATGETDPFSSAAIEGTGGTVVVVDAARPGRPAAVVFTASADAVRPGLVPVVTGGREAVVIRVDDLRDDEYDNSAADARAAHALLLIARAETSEPSAAADRALAEAVLA